MKDAQPLPRSDDILESFDGAQWFSCLDLASGYWQVPVAHKDRAKTAFVTQGTVSMEMHALCFDQWTSNSSKINGFSLEGIGLADLSYLP